MKYMHKISTGSEVKKIPTFEQTKGIYPSLTYN